MTLSAVLSAPDSATRSTLVDAFIAKAQQACFVDWVVGLALIAFYAIKLHVFGGFDPQGVSLTSADLWPLIGALAITRAGNTATNAVRDWAYWRFHRPGEQNEKDA